MSPVGGVGVNLAVQDAVAAANILAEPLRAGAVDDGEHLDRCRSGANFPMQVIQRMQVVVQNNLLSPALASAERPKPPFVHAAAAVVSGCCAAFRRGSSASACGPSTSRRPNVL